MSFFSRPTGTWLARLLGPKITVVASATAVEFRCGERSLSLEPALFVRDDIIVSVGIAVVSSVKLQVFTDEDSDRAQRIGKFMSYGLWAIMGRKRLSIRPVVKVAFDRLVVSEEELRAALLNAGAAEVTAT